MSPFSSYTPSNLIIREEIVPPAKASLTLTWIKFRFVYGLSQAMRDRVLAKTGIRP